MSIMVATAMASRASGRTGRPSITVLDECWFLLDSPALAPEVVQLFGRRANGTQASGVSARPLKILLGPVPAPPARTGHPQECQYENHRSATRRRQRARESPLPESSGSGPGQGVRSAPQRPECRGAAGHRGKAETTQTIRIVPTPLSYWICTTFPRERKLSCVVSKQIRRTLIARMLSRSRQEVPTRTCRRDPTARGIVRAQ